MNDSIVQTYFTTVLYEHTEHKNKFYYSQSFLIYIKDIVDHAKLVAPVLTIWRFYSGPA